MPPHALAAGAASAKALGGVAVAGVSAGKLLLAGVLAGSLLASGVGVLVVRGLPFGHTGAASRGGDVQAATTYAGTPDRAASVPSGTPFLQGVAAPTGNGPTPGTVDQALAPAAQTASPAPVGGGEPSASPSSARAVQPRAPAANHDLLMREAALVSEARTDIVQGRAVSALEVLDAIRHDGTHDLEPEELALRVRALHMLGRDSEAAEVERTLRDRYPDSFLAR